MLHLSIYIYFVLSKKADFFVTFQESESTQTICAYYKLVGYYD